jgi:hypothetical protein
MIMRRYANYLFMLLFVYFFAFFIHKFFCTFEANFSIIMDY